MRHEPFLCLRQKLYTSGCQSDSCNFVYLRGAGSVSEGVQEANDAVSEAGTGDDSAAATEAALMQAQQDQREAMLVSQNSLRDSRKQLLEVQETLQRQAEESHGNSSKLASRVALACVLL